MTRRLLRRFWASSAPEYALLAVLILLAWVLW